MGGFLSRAPQTCHTKGCHKTKASTKPQRLSRIEKDFSSTQPHQKHKHSRNHDILEETSNLQSEKKKETNTLIIPLEHKSPLNNQHKKKQTTPTLAFPTKKREPKKTHARPSEKLQGSEWFFSGARAHKSAGGNSSYKVVPTLSLPPLPPPPELDGVKDLCKNLTEKARTCFKEKARLDIFGHFSFNFEELSLFGFCCSKMCFSFFFSQVVLVSMVHVFFRLDCFEDEVHLK